MKLFEAIEVHDTLNPKLWDSNNNLLPDVNNKLKQIYKEFLDYIDIPLNIVDIELVGSNASYNYTEDSDIDLHIIVNSQVNYMNGDLLQQFYNSKKTAFNDKYDVTINNIPIELYIEDVTSGNATNGRYSLLKDEWVLVPKPITYNIPNIKDELATYISKANEALNSNDSEIINNFINEVYMMRKLGLAEGGEASVGNLVFKELRNMKILDDLRDKYYDLKSSELSL